MGQEVKKESGKDRIIKACELIQECLEMNDIKITTALDAFQCIFANQLLEAGFTYEGYAKEMNHFSVIYKKLWDKK